MANKFVEGWNFQMVLGDGTFGEVRLAVSENSDEAVAVKVINVNKSKSLSDAVRKEICIQKKLSHPNIIKFYGARQEGDFYYLILEYAIGGELYDRIDADKGMSSLAEVQRVFRQIVAGVEYLHSEGITHRDLKPENILFDNSGNVKIIDFGLATMFRLKGQERLLDKKCGTMAYVAPEVLESKSYHAEPADIWSIGIILVAMTTGEQPFDEPTLRCPVFAQWKKQEKIPLWDRINPHILSLVCKILVESPDKRFTIASIKNHSWFSKNYSSKRPLSDAGSPGSSQNSQTGTQPFKLARLSFSRSSSSQPTTSYFSSQPEMRSGEERSELGQDTKFSFSQPAQAEDLLLSSQIQGTPGSQTPLQKLVRRMTRFCVKTELAETLKEMRSVFDSLGFSHKVVGKVVTVSTTDRRRNRLVFKATLLELGGTLLVDFRLSKGDGLEFKRQFLKIKDGMKSVISRVQPAWPMSQAQ